MMRLDRRMILGGFGLLLAGLHGHVQSAIDIGGSFRAFRDHLLGFVVLTLGTGLLIATVGRRFWPRRHDVTILVLGIVQAVIGLLVYLDRFAMKG